ncbi:hypothetical protein [Caldimonas sp. KR1-144]|uniref:hypothetical protein n=1 Tax=Caldimonas sp. KR1-144 TaxID=3400911 RepID=UPI003BFD585D
MHSSTAASATTAAPADALLNDPAEIAGTATGVLSPGFALLLAALAVGLYLGGRGRRD